MSWTRKRLIKEFLDFYKSRGHREIPNFSLIPENDPAVLFTTAGMHPLINFLAGEKHPFGKRLCNVQRCIRTVDIEEVGDETHHTFFEMLGNWSLGDYFKKQAIEYSFEFLTKILKLPKDKLAATCFEGDKNSSKDTESAKIWMGLGIKKIAFLGKEDNWWGPVRKTGPCGPDTEIFFWNSKKPVPRNFNPKDKTWVEIGNNVLMQYTKDETGRYISSDQENIDFGGGVERILAVLNNSEDNYLLEIWQPVIKEIEKISGKSYEKNKKAMRIIADHIKASVFIIGDGIVPSNVERGYVLRRLIRRAIRYGRELGIKGFTGKIALPVIEMYDDYRQLEENKRKIIEELEKEEEKFERTIESGTRIFNKLAERKKEISGKDSFLLYQSYGFPIEMIIEMAKEKNIKLNIREFEEENRKHQELSRTATVGRFKSGLADNQEMTTKLHTASHLLLAALRKVLNNKNIIQKGSNITSERLRLDFSFDRKLTEQEIKQIEGLVNEQIKKSLNIICKEMPLEEAKKQGASGVFDEKYGEKVRVYMINDFSREICAGPHVKNTKELGKFKILKEESSSAGVRRIKAILE